MVSKQGLFTKDIFRPYLPSALSSALRSSAYNELSSFSVPQSLVFPSSLSAPRKLHNNCHAKAIRDRRSRLRSPNRGSRTFPGFPHGHRAREGSNTALAFERKKSRSTPRLDGEWKNAVNKFSIATPIMTRGNARGSENDRGKRRGNEEMKRSWRLSRA